MPVQCFLEMEFQYKVGRQLQGLPQQVIAVPLIKRAM
jgi:hypothetical protein